MERLVAQLEALGSAVEAQQSHERIDALLHQTEAVCRNAEGLETREEPRRLLAQLRPALQTWRDVWPRLGAQREFRLAIAREAHGWSKRLGPRAGERAG